MATAQDLIDAARIPLNDDEKTRWPDATLLGYLNAGIKNLLSRRPDMFIGAYTPSDLALGDNVTVSAMAHQQLVDYVTARAMFIDDDIANSKAAAMLELSRSAA